MYMVTWELWFPLERTTAREVALPRLFVSASPALFVGEGQKDAENKPNQQNHKIAQHRNFRHDCFPPRSLHGHHLSMLEMQQLVALVTRGISAHHFDRHAQSERCPPLPPIITSFRNTRVRV
jgi:hypothetical protein